MFLSKPELLEALRTQALQFDPPILASELEHRVRQVSIDLVLGGPFRIPLPPRPHIPAIVIEPSFLDDPSLWQQQEGEEITLKPGEFVLAKTLEKITMPNSLIGFVEG